MKPERFADETLMAYADGELDAATAQAVAAAEAGDPDVAARIALFRDTAAALTAARAARPAPEAPDALVARVRETLKRRGTGQPDTILPFARPAPRRPWVPSAIAASLALALGLGAGLSLRGPMDPAPRAESLAALEASGVAGALTRLASGASEQVAAGEVTVVSSFRTPDGTLCREFDLTTAEQGTVGVACAEGASWGLRFAVVTGGSGGAGYSPAGALEALDVWLMGIEAGVPLSEAEESAALKPLAQ